MASPLTLGQAHGLAAFFTLSYVGSLYVSKNARLSFSSSGAVHVEKGKERERLDFERWRNDAGVIKARLLAVSISTALSCAVVYATVGATGSDPEGISAVHRTVDYLGLNPLRTPLLSLLVAPILYLGPLYAGWLGRSLPFQGHWSYRTDFLPLITTWQGIRNYWMGPLTEELVFRACVLAVYHLAGVGLTKLIFISPFAFGAAHLHHAWDVYNRFGRTADAARRAVFMTLFQLAYTSLFGFHCAFLFLRTGSFYPPLISHIFCNIMGLPQLGGELRDYPKKRIHISVAYIVGIVGYVYAMRSWTKAPGSLYWG